MYRIRQKCIIPSAAFTIPHARIRSYHRFEKTPEVGDLVFGEVNSLGQHRLLESVSSRLHALNDRTHAIFVFGNRYAPDYYEAFVPDQWQDEVDLIAQSGIVGNAVHRNDRIGDPTRVRLQGYVCDANGEILNTRRGNLLTPRRTVREGGRRAKLILCVGTSMNSGKSHAAAACCYALTSVGKKVRAAKVTGTACHKDILLMQDNGADHVADFTYLGHPTTYMLSESELMNIFTAIDLKYGNNPANYLVVEFADGILQRETAMLLQNPMVLSRIHKVVFCAQDAFGAIGGVRVLKERFGLVPAAISGVCSSSPLALRELSEFTDIPILFSAQRDYKAIYELIM